MKMNWAVMTMWLARFQKSAIINNYSNLSTVHRKEKYDSLIWWPISWLNCFQKLILLYNSLQSFQKICFSQLQTNVNESPASRIHPIRSRSGSFWFASKGERLSIYYAVQSTVYCAADLKWCLSDDNEHIGIYELDLCGKSFSKEWREDSD